MGLISLLIFSLLASFVAGLVIVIGAKTKERRKLGIILLIIPVIVLIIGGAVCGIMLSGIGGMH